MPKSTPQSHDRLPTTESDLHNCLTSHETGCFGFIFGETLENQCAKSLDVFINDQTEGRNMWRHRFIS